MNIHHDFPGRSAAPWRPAHVYILPSQP